VTEPKPVAVDRTTRAPSKNSSFFVVLHVLSVPALMIIFFLWSRGPTHEGRTAAQWFQLMQMSAEHADKDPGLLALKHLGKPAVRVLRRSLKSPGEVDRLKAAWALGRLGACASNAIPDLSVAANDRNLAVQVGAIQALAAIGTAREDLIPRFLIKLTNSNWHISAASADLINRIEKEMEVQGTLDYGRYFEHSKVFLKASAPHARVVSLPRFTKCSERGEQVAAEFEHLLNDPNGWVREETAKALRQHKLPEERLIPSTGTSNFISFFWVK
jgi:HEAT repeat protein